MGTQQTIGVIIMLATLVGLAYFFLYKGTPAVVTSGDDPDEGTEMQPILGLSAEDHVKLAGFEVRAVEFRKQVSKLTARSALPRGLKDNIYAFTEDVRQIDSVTADKYYAEFCEGRAELPLTEEFRRSRSRLPSEARLNANLRNNDDSAFRALEAGQFNISREGGKRGSWSLQTHLSGETPSGSFESAETAKNQQLNPESTQEVTAVGGLSAFDSSPTINTRDDTASTETPLAGNKEKTNPTVARLKVEKAYIHGKAELVSHEAFNAFHALEGDNRVSNKKRKIATPSIVIKREAPAIPGPNFNTVAVPHSVLAADDVDKTTIHNYLHQLDLCLIDMAENYTESKYDEAKALIALIGDKDPSFNLTRYRMETETAKSKNSKKARKIGNVYFAKELENLEKQQGVKRARLGMIRTLPGLSRGTSGTSASSLSSSPRLGGGRGNT